MTVGIFYDHLCHSVYGSFIICAYAFSHLSISTKKRRFQMGDYAANNIKIFIARRLIESNGQRLFETLLPEVPWLPRGRHAGASGFSQECVGTIYAHLMPGAHYGPVTTEYQRNRWSTQPPKFSAHSLATRNTKLRTKLSVIIILKQLITLLAVNNNISVDNNNIK